MTDLKPLRLWPGVMFAVAMVVLYFAAPMALPDVELPVGLMGMMVGAIGILIWWLFFSRAPWVERIGAILLMVVAVFVMPAPRASVNLGRGAGHVDVHPADSGLDARARDLGRRHAPSQHRPASRRAGGGDCARVRAVSDHPNRWRQHPGIPVPLAVDADG